MLSEATGKPTDVLVDHVLNGGTDMRYFKKLSSGIVLIKNRSFAILLFVRSVACLIRQIQFFCELCQKIPRTAKNLVY